MKLLYYFPILSLLLFTVIMLCSSSAVFAYDSALTEIRSAKFVCRVKISYVDYSQPLEPVSAILLENLKGSIGQAGTELQFKYDPQRYELLRRQGPADCLSRNLTKNETTVLCFSSPDFCNMELYGSDEWLASYLRTANEPDENKAALSLVDFLLKSMLTVKYPEYSSSQLIMMDLDALYQAQIQNNSEAIHTLIKPYLARLTQIALNGDLNGILSRLMMFAPALSLEERKDLITALLIYCEQFKQTEDSPQNYGLNAPQGGMPAPSVQQITYAKAMLIDMLMHPTPPTAPDTLPYLNEREDAKSILQKARQFVGYSAPYKSKILLIAAQAEKVQNEKEQREFAAKEKRYREMAFEYQKKYGKGSAELSHVLSLLGDLYIEQQRYNDLSRFRKELQQAELPKKPGR